MTADHTADDLDLDVLRNLAAHDAVSNLGDPSVREDLGAARALLDRLEAAEAKVARVEALHQRGELRPMKPWCRECGLHYPCPTVRALSGGLS